MVMEEFQTACEVVYAPMSARLTPVKLYGGTVTKQDETPPLVEMEVHPVGRAFVVTTLWTV